MQFEYEDLAFKDNKEFVEVSFLNLFGFELEKKELETLSYKKCSANTIFFKKDPGKRWMYTLENGFKRLKNKLNNKPAVYIHRNSGIPLIGHIAFGLIDRNTSLIELKPITGCNLNCIYCSVDAEKRQVDFVVEKDYLIEELKKLIKTKGNSNIEVHINAQGEPLFYRDLTSLVKDIAAIPAVKIISMDTNGSLLSEKMVDELIKAGLTRFNISLNSLNPDIAKQIAGTTAYNVNHLKQIISYIAGKKKDALIITPVRIPGINDREIIDIIKLAKILDVPVGIQNFLNYKYGKNPANQISFDCFYAKLRELEQEYSIKLRYCAMDFGIIPTKKLECLFKKGDIIKARIVCDGRLKDEKIAVANGRVISIPGFFDNNTKNVLLKIVRTKHNILLGKKIN